MSAMTSNTPSVPLRPRDELLEFVLAALCSVLLVSLAVWATGRGFEPRSPTMGEIFTSLSPLAGHALAFLVYTVAFNGMTTPNPTSRSRAPNDLQAAMIFAAAALAIVAVLIGHLSSSWLLAFGLVVTPVFWTIHAGRRRLGFLAEKTT